MNLPSFESWRSAIDNLPNSIFITQPVNRKNALKNKFDAVFSVIGENNYAEAIDKLTNYILKKLDADGKADWVKQPALVDELNAFIAFLTYKARPVSEFVE